MKTTIVRTVLAAVGFVGMIGAPAAFAGERNDIRRDYREVRRENVEIRGDRARLRDDFEDGRYWRAARDRAELDREYRERNRVRRDIRHDDYRYGWR